MKANEEAMIRERSPFFSIVIPTYNRPERLATCLDSLTKLNYPRDRFEVIVVDDGSTIPVESAAFKDSLNLTIIRQPNTGPAKARNTGAAKARGEFLAFTDDDCKPDPDWLPALAAQFTKTPDCLIGGKTINELPDNLYSTASQSLIDYLYSYYNADPQGASFFASNNLALPAAAFRQLGSFDTTFPLAAGEDRELCDRWLHHGYKLFYAPEAQVYHAHKLALNSFWRQHFNYGRGAFHFHKVRSQRNTEQIKIEPWSFYLKLLAHPLSQPSKHPKLLVSALFILSQVANVAGFFREKNR